MAINTSFSMHLQNFPNTCFVLPWVPETFLARFPVSVSRPSANTETSRRTREKPLVPRVVLYQKVNLFALGFRKPVLNFPSQIGIQLCDRDS